MLRKIFLVLLLSVLASLKAQYINVTTALSPQQMVDKFIGSSNSCVAVSNVTASGWDFGSGDLSYGYFDKGSSSFPIDEGIILSTGKAKAAEGPINGIQSAYDSRWFGDTDLITALRLAGLPTSNILNATSLEFDFVSYQNEEVSFDYMFLSEEYYSGNCGYSDAFAFLIKEAGSSDDYDNIALIPGTSIPVTSISINGSARCSSNTEFFGGFNAGISNNPTNFNGQTKVLSAKAKVKKGVTYHIKLVIADEGDSRGLYDSAVFLKAGSFLGHKDLGIDRLVSTNNALCAGDSLLLDATEPSAAYQWYKDGSPISGATNPTYNVTSPGYYEVDIQGTSCPQKGSIEIEYNPQAILDVQPIQLCDNFDNVYKIRLADYSGRIVDNYDPATMELQYFKMDGTLIDPNIYLTLTQPLTKIKIKAFYKICPTTVTEDELSISFKDKVIANAIPVVSICDNTRSGSALVNLSDYPSMIAESDVRPTYYRSDADARIFANPITAQQNISGNTTFYIRFDKSGKCPIIIPIDFVLNQPNQSAILHDETICKNATTILDAGTGFDSVEWFDEAAGQSLATGRTITVGPGKYYAKLGSNGCFYDQHVVVSTYSDVVIDKIDIKGKSVTIGASGGDGNYQYRIDNGVYSSGNTFTNLTMGTHTVYVKDGKGCQEVSKTFSVINVVNAFTPNGDGINDVLDFSDLKLKDNPRFTIFDRYGTKVFDGTKANNFIWDGKSEGRPLPTSSYWYILQWTEFGSTTQMQLSGWILLKDR